MHYMAMADRLQHDCSIYQLSIVYIAPLPAPAVFTFVVTPVFFKFCLYIYLENSCRLSRIVLRIVHDIRSAVIAYVEL